MSSDRPTYTSHDLYTRGLLIPRAAIYLALIESGWDDADAEDLLTEFETDNVAPSRKRGPFTIDDYAIIDKALADAGGILPHDSKIVALARDLRRDPGRLARVMERRLEPDEVDEEPETDE